MTKSVTTIQMDKEVHRSLKIVAAQKGKTFNELMKYFLTMEDLTQQAVQEGVAVDPNQLKIEV